MTVSDIGYKTYLFLKYLKKRKRSTTKLVIRTIPFEEIPSETRLIVDTAAEVAIGQSSVQSQQSDDETPEP